MEIQVDGLSKREVREIQKTFQRFVNKYKENPERETVEWLDEQLQAELPREDKGKVRQMASQIAEAIVEYDRDLKDLNQSCRAGMTKEAWLAERLQDGAKGVAVKQFGDYLHGIDQNLEQCNQQMVRTVLRADGEVSQNMNLDGFIAEQYHVNDFNAKAELAGSPYRARVCIPDGRYAKDSVDVVIDNIQTEQRSIERYQLKFGKDAKATIGLLKSGNYNNQRLIVPKGQVQEVQNAFPGKTVTDYIGGTQNVSISSDAVTKEQIKDMQLDAQKYGKLPKTDWNSYQTREMALNIGKQAGQAGIQAAFIGMGVNMVQKAMQGEKVEPDEVIETALETGSDACVKAAAGGALKAVSEKGILSVLPPGTPAGTIAKMACVGVENAKVLWKVAKGDLTMSEGLEQMGRTSVSMYSGFGGAAIGAKVGAAVCSPIPVIGPVVGGIVGGIAGWTAGSKVGEKVFEGAKKVVKKGIEVAKKIEQKANEVKNAVKSGVKNFMKSIFG